MNWVEESMDDGVGAASGILFFISRERDGGIEN